MATGKYPLFRSDGKYSSAIGVMLDGFKKHDPPIKNMSPVEVNLPELICDHGLNPLAYERDKAVGDLTMIAFYYLLRCG